MRDGNARVIIEACVSNSIAPVKSSWGGARPGAGRKPRPQPIPIPVVDPTQPRWSVIAYHGQSEISATAELARQGYEVYLALIAIRRRDPVITSQWHIVRVPLLPGYGFIRLARCDPRRPIIETRGVREVLLRPDGHPAVMRDADIDRLKADDADRLKLPLDRKPALATGALVSILDGPFTDHKATVVECDGVRTQVSMTLMGRLVPMWIDRIAVEPIA
jgi:transcription antitermination factor NusG